MSSRSTKKVWEGIGGGSKELRQLYRRLDQLGVEFRRTGGGHLELRFPDGRRRTFPTSSTNHHVKADLRKEIKRLEEAPDAPPPGVEISIDHDGPMLPPPATPLGFERPETTEQLTRYLEGPGKPFVEQHHLDPKRIKRLRELAEQQIHANDEPIETPEEEEPVAMAEETRSSDRRTVERGHAAAIWRVLRDHPGVVFDVHSMSRELSARGGLLSNAQISSGFYTIQKNPGTYPNVEDHGKSGNARRYVYRAPGVGSGTAPSEPESAPEEEPIAPVVPITPAPAPVVEQPTAEGPKELLLQIVHEDPEKGLLAIDLESKVTYWVQRA